MIDPLPPLSVHFTAVVSVLIDRQDAMWHRMRRSSVQFVTSWADTGTDLKSVPGILMAQLSLQGLPLILRLVAHQLAAFRAEAVDRQQPAGARSGDQCTTLLALMKNALLVTIMRLTSLGSPGGFRFEPWRYRIGHGDRLQTQGLGPVAEIYRCSRTGTGCWSRLGRRGTLARALRDLLQHQLKPILLLLGAQLLSEVAVIGRDRQRYQPRRQEQSSGQPGTRFCPAFSIHGKFVPRLQRLPVARV